MLFTLGFAAQRRLDSCRVGCESGIALCQFRKSRFAVNPDGGGDGGLTFFHLGHAIIISYSRSPATLTAGISCGVILRFSRGEHDKQPVKGGGLDEGQVSLRSNAPDDSKEWLC